jgi:hypothetical protein
VHRLVLIVAVVSIPTLVHADSTRRQTFVSVMGGYSIAAPPEATEAEEFDHGLLIGASLAWDRAPPEYIRIRGERVGRAELVPEATVQVTGRDGMLLGGVRMQLALSEYEVGLFRMSSRGKLWLAPRVGVGTQATGAILGGDFGLAFHTGGIEIGGWLGVYVWKEATTGAMDSDPARPPLYGPDEQRILQLQGGLLFSSSSL